MPKIIQLDEQLANKIAAGEVVERPASVVKELVENSLDAGSTQIMIDVEEGGLKKIQVTDNGEGIPKEEVENAFLRHATSKIENEKDLFQIRTLGFRGEALPSIASVSFLEMNTSTGDDVGVRIKLEGGKIVSRELAKSRKGTQVIVTNLFYNTPARLKHLKTIHTELGNISDVVNRLALAHPEVSFRLTHHGKTILFTTGNGQLLPVIASIYGRTVAKQMVPVSGESLDFQLSGYISKPEVTRASRQYISLFINGRYIRNNRIVHAIYEGYHTLLPVGRHPVVILHIKMDPVLIDVNVHPTKLEARISKEDELYTLVKETIKKTFQKMTLIPNVQKPKKKTIKAEEIPLSFELYRPVEDVIKEAPLVEQREEEKEVLVHPGKLQGSSAEKREREMEMGKREEQETTKEKKNEPTEKTVPSERIPPLYPIGQLHGTYILAQNENGLYMIDQHAAQERILYEYFRDKVGKVTSEVQDLIVPITLTFTPQEKMIIKEHLELFRQVGIFLEPFGSNTYIVRSHPVWFPEGKEEETIREIVEQVMREKKADIQKMREDSAIVMSCKAAIKANRHLRDDEIIALLESLRRCENPFTCPHGRPVIVHFSTYEIEKMFKRIM